MPLKTQRRQTARSIQRGRPALANYATTDAKTGLSCPVFDIRGFFVNRTLLVFRIRARQAKSQPFFRQ
jgi:hypothetical protein